MSGCYRSPERKGNCGDPASWSHRTAWPTLHGCHKPVHSGPLSHWLASVCAGVGCLAGLWGQWRRNQASFSAKRSEPLALAMTSRPVLHACAGGARQRPGTWLARTPGELHEVMHFLLSFRNQIWGKCREISSPFFHSEQTGRASQLMSIRPGRRRLPRPLPVFLGISAALRGRLSEQLPSGVLS